LPSIPNHSSPKILLLTHRSDYFTIDRVAAALAEAGARPVRLDTDDFPTRIGLSLRDDGDEGGRPRFCAAPFAAAGEQVPGGLSEPLPDLSRVAAVWTRSPWPPELPEDLDPAYRQSCADQCRCLLDGWLDGLHQASWINPPMANQRAGNKVIQHRLAHRAGLELPPTLITNDDAQARDFFHRHGGDVMAKLLLPLSRSMDGSGQFLPTTALTADDLEHLEALRLGPMILQRRVPKDHELRVMVVDGELFVGAIRTGAVETGTRGPEADDWRVSDPRQVRWRRGRLEPRAAEGLRRLMSSLGLVAGVADFIITPQDRAVFLEINPLGEWGMLERDLELAISHALARALLRRAASNASATLASVTHEDRA
jgi:glutathione synthase/RimK-type ligase-like ATP-grasp enzyme